MTTLDEAIKHCEEKAKELKAKVPYKIFGDEWQQEDEDCMKCAEEHEQLAEWLKELKELRSNTKRLLSLST